MTTRTLPSSDFYGLERTLEPSESPLCTPCGRSCAVRWRRSSTTTGPAPGSRSRSSTGSRELGIAGLPYEGYGCPGRRHALDGMVFMEIARTDPSIATFHGVHSGLAMGSIYVCGSDEQTQRWLPGMARLEQIGAFGLTEPDVGSDASRGLTTRPPRR